MLRGIIPVSPVNDDVIPVMIISLLMIKETTYKIHVEKAIKDVIFSRGYIFLPN